MFVQASNLFDHKFYTGALLALTGFNAAGNFVARALQAVNGQFPVPQATFYAPAAPRSLMGGS